LAGYFAFFVQVDNFRVRRNPGPTASDGSVDIYGMPTARRTGAVSVSIAALSTMDPVDSLL
jgi:hypothetical protein